VIVLKDLFKSFGKVVATDIPFLKIEDKEFFGLLGPSGSGKTTTLRLIAGLTKPDRGSIFLDDEDITGLPPEKRNLGMVFQSWALFPHLTAFENIAFGLRLRKLPESEVRKRVKWAAEILQIENLLSRYPHQLSGGQQQRVAVARAIVIQPRALLFDEPLSNLDAKLREQVRFELRRLQKELGITSIYVTHDQAEAFAICDRIAVIDKGRIQQVGTPEEIYDRPANKFVASFIGVTYFIEGKLIEVLNNKESKILVKTEDDLEIIATGDLSKLTKGEEVCLVIRPDYVSLASPNDKVNVFEGEIRRATYTGEVIDYEIKIGMWDVRVRTSPSIKLPPGRKVRVKLDEGRLVALPKKSF